MKTLIISILLLLATQAHATIIVNQLDDYESYASGGGGGASRSMFGEFELSSRFSLDADYRINTLTWSGFLEEDEGSMDFTIRIYDELEDNPNCIIFESDIVASYELITDNRDYKPYLFSYNYDGSLELGNGDYWITIMGSESMDTVFSIGIENGDWGTIYGSGGAFRENDDADWKPTNSGISTLEARGRSFMLEGVEIPAPHIVCLLCIGFIGIFKIKRQQSRLV